MSVDNISRADELVPSRYAVQVGDIEVLVISDGVLPITASTLATSTPSAELAGWLDNQFLPHDVVDWPLNVVVVRTGGRTDRVHQHVQAGFLADLGERPAYLEVSQVRADQQLAAAAARVGERADAGGVVDIQPFEADASVPDVQLVEQGLGKGHELAKHAA